MGVTGDGDGGGKRASQEPKNCSFHWSIHLLHPRALDWIKNPNKYQLKSFCSSPAYGGAPWGILQGFKDLCSTCAPHRRVHSSSEVILASPKILQQGDLQLCLVSWEQLPSVRFVSKKKKKKFSIIFLFFPPLTILFSLLPCALGDFYYFTICKAETPPCSPSNQENPQSKGHQIRQSPSDLQQHKEDQLWPGATQLSQAISGRLSKFGSITQVYAPSPPCKSCPIHNTGAQIKEDRVD